MEHTLAALAQFAGLEVLPRAPGVPSASFELREVALHSDLTELDLVEYAFEIDS